MANIPSVPSLGGSYLRQVAENRQRDKERGSMLGRIFEGAATHGLGRGLGALGEGLAEELFDPLKRLTERSDVGGVPQGEYIDRDPETLSVDALRTRMDELHGSQEFRDQYSGEEAQTAMNRAIVAMQKKLGTTQGRDELHDLLYPSTQTQADPTRIPGGYKYKSEQHKTLHRQNVLKTRERQLKLFKEEFSMAKGVTEFNAKQQEKRLKINKELAKRYPGGAPMFRVTKDASGRIRTPGITMSVSSSWLADNAKDGFARITSDKQAQEQYMAIAKNNSHFIEWYMRSAMMNPSRIGFDYNVETPVTEEVKKLLLKDQKNFGRPTTVINVGAGQKPILEASVHTAPWSNQSNRIRVSKSVTGKGGFTQRSATRLDTLSERQLRKVVSIGGTTGIELTTMEGGVLKRRTQVLSEDQVKSVQTMLDLYKKMQKAERAFNKDKRSKAKQNALVDASEKLNAHLGDKKYDDLNDMLVDHWNTLNLQGDVREPTGSGSKTTVKKWREKAGTKDAAGFIALLSKDSQIWTKDKALYKPKGHSIQVTFGNKSRPVNINNLGLLYTWDKGTDKATKSYESALAAIKKNQTGQVDIAAIQQAGIALAWLRWKSENGEPGEKPPASLGGVSKYLPAFDTLNDVIDRNLKEGSFVMPPEVQRLDPMEQEAWERIRGEVVAKRMTPQGARRAFIDTVKKMRAAKPRRTRV